MKDCRDMSFKKSKVLIAIIIALVGLAGCNNRQSESLCTGTFVTTEQVSEDCYYICIEERANSKNAEYIICIYKQLEDEFFVSEGKLKDKSIICDEDTLIILDEDNKAVLLKHNSTDYTLTSIDEVAVFINNDKASEAFENLREE